MTETGGISVTTADADLVVSAWLVAVTVTVCWEATFVGAVYNPALETDPVPAGLIDQVTDVFAAFETVAENCWVWPPYNVAAAGETLTETGKNGDRPQVPRLMFAEPVKPIVLATSSRQFPSFPDPV